jgi:hypothetical protein
MPSHHDGRTSRERRRTAAIERSARRQECLDDVRDARNAIPPGEPFTQAAYCAWREAHLAERWPPPACPRTIRRILGSWAAVRAILDRDNHTAVRSATRGR